MTIETQTPRVVIIGNGTLGPYSLVDSSGQAIRFMSTSHLRLTRYSASTDDNNDGSLLVLNTDYSVGGTQDARTFTLIGSQAVLTSSQRILAERVQTYTQDLDLTTGGAFSATALETRFDKIAEFQQELKAQLARKVSLQYNDATADVALPSPPTSATQVIGHNTSGELVHVTPASLGTDVALGTGWETLLGLPTTGVLDNLSGVRTVSNNAALTALTTATGLADNAIYKTLGYSTERDGGEGFWVYDSASTTTATTGTVLAIDGGGTGRFFRLTDGWVSLEMFGGGTVANGFASCTTAYNAWVTAITAGTAPKTLRFAKDGTYHWETKPSKLEDLSSVTIYADGIRVVVTRGWDSASDVKEAIFHAYGSTQLVAYGFAGGTAADGSYGGAIVTLEATSSAAPDFSNLQDLYLTSYGSASAVTITGASTASEAVFTSAAHGYSNGQTVVYLYGLGGTWATMTHQLFDVSDVTTDTFKLKYTGTSTYFDSSGLGTYTANSASVKRDLACDYPIVIDGSARTTGAIGVRGAKIHNCQIFGGRKGAMLVNGAIGLDMPGTTTSDAGWDATIRATGSASVPNYYLIFEAGSVARVALDRCYYTTIMSQIQGELVQTANTLYTNALSPIGKGVTRLGTQNSGPDFIWLGGGMAYQKKAITGVNGSYAAFTWPVAFRAAPTMYGAQAYNSSSTSALCVVNAVSTTGVEVAGTNLHASGLAIIWAIGEI